MIWSSCAVSRSIAGAGSPARGGRCSGVLLCRQRVVNGRGHLHGIAVTADMHVEGRRVGAQQMVVDRRDFEAVLDQLGHDRIDLGLKQHEIAHHHRAAMRRLESRPAAERQRRPDGRHRRASPADRSAESRSDEHRRKPRRLRPIASSTFFQSTAPAALGGGCAAMVPRAHMRK